MVEISYESEWYTVLAISQTLFRIEKRSFGEQRMTKPQFSRNTQAIQTHERRSAGFPGRAWTVSNIKLSGREWIVSINDESTLHNYEISCNDVCEVPSWPQRARQQTDHSYAAGLLGTEQRREISSRIKRNLLHDLGSAHGQGRPLPSGQLPWNLPVTGLSLSLSPSILATWNLRKPEVHFSIPSLKMRRN